MYLNKNNAINFQLSPVIIQEVKPTDLYNIKLIIPPKRYMVPEKELLRILKTLKEFETILIGKRLELFTDHKSHTDKNFNTYR